MSIFIHIGTHKTGTTAIQEYFSSNSEWLLEEFGILYPKSGRLQSHQGHHVFPWSINGKHGQSDSRCWHDLSEEIGNSNARDVFLSSEEFCKLNEEEFRRVKHLIENLQEVSVICYLRQPQSFLLSAYKEHVKTPKVFAGGFQQFVSGNLEIVDYASLLRRLASVFGSGSVRVRSFELTRDEEGLIASLGAALGINLTCAANDFHQMNKSPSDSTIAIVAWLNRHLQRHESDRIRKRVIWKLRDLVLRLNLGQIPLITQNEWRESMGIGEKFLNENYREIVSESLLSNLVPGHHLEYIFADQIENDLQMNC